MAHIMGVRLLVPLHKMGERAQICVKIRRSQQKMGVESPESVKKMDVPIDFACKLVKWTSRKNFFIKKGQKC
ncbi:hypothetical protein [Ligaoa zhengdingensis]|uniref:hypothetical protein n=1 Tax=Ligaoa zhengdingensis TaxID=2763658 RepID=UPI0031BBC9E9